MPDFSSFRPAPKTRRTPNLYAPQQQPQGYSDREVDMWNAQRGMAVMQENIARAGGGVPTTRRTGSSSTSQPGVISAGEKVTRVQRGDGSIIPVAAVTGDRHLIRPKGSSNIYVSPSTGERFKPDPASPMGLSSIGTARAEAMAKQAEKDAKLAAKQAVADEKEAIRQENDRREAAFAAEGRPSYTDAHGRIQPKQSDEAWEATKKQKQAGKEKANEYLKDGRRFYTDKITGLPVPMTSDEEHARNKAEKMAKIQKDAAERPHKQRLDVLKAELSNPDLKVSDKDLKDADEALTAASAPLMALRGNDDFATPISDDEVKGMLKDADPAKKAAANAYLNAREKVGKLAKAEAQRKALEQEVYKTNLRIADPDKYAEELKAEAPAKSAEELKAHAAEIEKRIKARAAEHKAETDRIKAKDDELSAQHALTKERYDQALAKGEAPAVIGTLGDSLNDLEEQMTQWESESQDQRAAVNAQAEEINKDAANLKILGDEEKRRADEQQKQHVEQLDAVLPGAGKRYGDTVADAQKRAQDLQAKYPDPFAPEAKAAFDALQKDFEEKTGAITREVELKSTERADNLRAARIALDRESKLPAAANDDEARKRFDGLLEKVGLDPNNQDHKAAYLDANALKHLEEPTKAVWEPGDKIKKGFGSAVLSDGSLHIAPEFIPDAAKYAAVVEASDSTPAEKAKAMAALPKLQLAFAESALPVLKAAGSTRAAKWIPGIPSFQKWQAEKKREGSEVEQASEYLTEMGKRGELSKITDNVLRSTLAGFADIGTMTAGVAGMTGLKGASELAADWSQQTNRFTAPISMEGGDKGIGSAILGQTARMAGPMAAQLLITRGLGGGMASMAALAAGQTAGSQYAESYGKLRESGMTHKEAWKRAAPFALASGAVTAMIDAAGGRTGFAAALGQKAGSKAAIEAAKHAADGYWKNLARNVPREALAEIPKEFPDEMFSQISQALAEDPNADISQVVGNFMANAPAFLGAVALMGGSGGLMETNQEFKKKASDQPPAPDLGPAPTPSILPEQAAANAAAIDNWVPTGSLPSSIQDAAKAAHGKAPTPEQHTDTARTAAHALVEIAAGQDPRTMSPEVRRALGIKINTKTGAIEPLSKSVTPLVDSVEDTKGNHQPVITDAARAWLSKEVPTAGEMVKLSYAERVEQIQNPPKPEKKPKPAKAPSKPALEAVPDSVMDWDHQNKGRQGSEWFDGGRANQQVNAALDRASKVGGSDLATHGMAKAATLTGALRSLKGLLVNGTDKARNKGVLHTAPLAVEVGSAAQHTGTTSGGTSYRDGPFILVASASSSQSDVGIRDMANVHAVLVNDANVAQFDAIKAEILAIRPDMIVELYSNADKVAAKLTAKKPSNSAEQPAKGTDAPVSEVGKTSALPNAEVAGSEPAQAASQQDSPQDFGGYASEKAKLPRELASAKPAYSYGEKQFKLEFENDVDRAAYITAQATTSKRDADFLAFAMQHTGQTEAQVRAHGTAVRAYIKGHAASGTHGDTILIPSQGKAVQQKPQPAEQDKAPRGTTEAPAAPATKPAKPDDRKTEAQGLTGGALINAAETTSQAEVSKLEGEPKAKAVAARDAILAALRRYNGHLPIDLAKGDMGFAYQGGKVLVDVARAVKDIARDATSPQNAREMAQKLFDHEIIHFFAVQKVGAERVMEIWDELPDNVRDMVQTAYSVKLANADLPPAMLASFAGGHEYFRAMVEATRTGVLSEQVLGTELAAKWKQYLADVLAFLRDLSRQFASIKSEAKRKELMGKVDAIRKEITDALDAFEKSLPQENNSPGKEPAQAASTGAVSTTGTSSESPVKGSTETVAASDGAGSITNEKESSRKSAKPSAAKKPQQSAEKAVKTPKSSTQLTLSRKDAAPVLAFGESIPKAELYDSVDPEWSDGALETDPHVTVLYGLTKHEAAPVAKAIADHGPVTVTLGKMSLFESEDYDVLKIDVESPELRALNAKLSKLPNENSFPDYKPHMTIAYLKKGEGKKYVGDDTFEGKKITFDTMTFSPPSELRGDMGKPELPLSKTKSPAITPPEIKEAAPSLKSEGKFSADDKAEFASLADGLFQPPSAEVTYKAPIPPAKLGGFITLATKLAEREGDQRVDSPEKVAAFIDEALPGGKARALSDAFWSAIRMTNPSLPAGEVDWQAIYAPKVEPTAKEQDEAKELEITKQARMIVLNGNDPAKTYQDLVNLYESQPALTSKTSTSKINQAYSTPAPMAYLVSRMADVVGGTVIAEPAAGNGMLLIERHGYQTVEANELDPSRRARLAEQGIKSTDQDATVWQPSKTPDRVVANPPFGQVMEAGGSNKVFSTPMGDTTSIDHAIVLQSLATMAQDGRAAFIIGGPPPTVRTPEARAKFYRDGKAGKFFSYLYENNNVIDHFTVSGDLYKKQGAGWPLDIFVIRGKGRSANTLPGLKSPRIISSWEELSHELDRTDADRIKLNQLSAAEMQQRVDAMAGKLEGLSGSLRGDPSTSGTTGVRDGQTTSEAATPDRSGASESAGDSTNEAATGELPADRGLAGESTIPASERVESTEQPGERQQRPEQSVSDFQAPFPATSGVNPAGLLAPKNLIGPMSEAMARLKKDVGGDLVSFVREKLGYPKKTDISKYFFGDQIDALAQAIHTAENGGALVIGDQTGTGKGRIAAGLMKYCVGKGLIPVFVTKDQQLYDAMLDDLKDIDAPEVVPVISNENIKEKSLKDKLADLGAQQGEDAFNTIRETGDLPGKTNAIFTSYDQIKADDATGISKSERARAKRDMEPPPDKWRMAALRSVAPRAMFILDESHLAGGQSTTGWRFGALLKLAKHAYYSSATFAKRPDNMGIYFRTNLGTVGGDINGLIELMQAGGVPAMQIGSSMLAQDGQYMRRERSYQGITFQTHINQSSYERDKMLADNYTEGLRSIIAVQERMSQAANIVNTILSAFGKKASIPVGNRARLESSNFSAKLHNLVRQYLLAIKANSAAQIAAKAIKDGIKASDGTVKRHKVIVAVENTMESIITDLNAQGLPLNYNGVLQMYLNQMKRIKVSGGAYGREAKYFEIKEEAPEAFKDTKDSELRSMLVVPAMDPVTGESSFKVNEDVSSELIRRAMMGVFSEAREIINDIQLADMPLSPIDAMRQAVEREGIRTGEMTGRTTGIDKNGQVYQRTPAEVKGKLTAKNEFNNSDLDFLVINKTGSTGVSMHASDKFKDQRPRMMMVVQANLDINEFMQTLGRIHRAGQVELPLYMNLQSALPAENRPAAITGQKMSMLNANTTSNADSEVTQKDGVDIFNQYGDEVVHNYLGRNPGLTKMLAQSWQGQSGDSKLTDSNGSLYPLGDFQNAESGGEYGYLSRSVTGHLAILPVEEQEAFWEAVSADYRGLIEYLDQIGQNSLRASVLDLKAETVSSAPFTPGSDTGSVFGRPSTLEIVNAKMGKEPMAADEALKIANKARTTAENRQNAFMEASNARIEAEDKRKETTARNWSERREDWMDGQRQQRDTIANALGQIGMFGYYKRDDSSEGYAFVEDVQTNGEKLNTPSAQFAIVRVNDSQDRLKIPVSQLSQFFRPHMTTDAMRDRVAREGWERTWEYGTQQAIVTGNLMAALRKLTENGAHSRVISYTKDDGSQQMGIMLSSSVAKQLSENAENNAAVANADDAKAVMDAGYTIKNSNGNVRLAGSNGTYHLYVPESRAQGGKYWRDPGLLALTGEFNQTTKGTFAATFYDAATLTKVFDYLTNIQNDRFTRPIDSNSALGSPPTRARAGQTIRRFEQVWKPFFTYSDDTAPKEKRKAALRKIIDQFATPENSALWKQFAELPTDGLVPEDAERVAEAKELLPYLENLSLGQPPTGYRSPSDMLAATQAQMQGMNKPAAPAFQSKDLHAAYQRAIRGSSTSSASIRSVFDAAKKDQPSLSADEFKSQLKADYYAGLVGLEPSEQASSVEKAGQFTMRDSLGAVHTNMVFMPTTEAEMIDAAERDTTTTPDQILSDWAGTGEALGQNPTAQDAEYMAAVDSGDVAKQQAMVDAAAKAAGYGGEEILSHEEKRQWEGKKQSLQSQINIASKNIESASAALSNPAIQGALRKVAESSLIRNSRNKNKLSDEIASGPDPIILFHGRSSKWSEYRRNVTGRSIWATNDINVAKTYGPDAASLYMSMHNPLEVDAKGASFRQLEFEGVRLDADDLSTIAEERGHDGIIIRDFLDSNDDSGGDIVSDHYSVFSPNQIKSADPITRDADGNVIPLSKRFNHESNSILFQNPAPIDPTVANQGDTDENREAFARARGSYITNELTKANFEEIRQKVEEQIDEDEQGMLDNIQYKVANDEELSLEEEIARRMLANTLRTRGVRENDQAMVTLADSLWGQDIRDATETARKLAVRVDQFQSPQERLDAAMGRIIAPNRANLRERLTNVWTPSAKRREIARLEGEIAKAATAASRASLERTLAEAKARMDQNDLIDKMAAENREAVDKVLTRLGLTQADLSMTPDDRHSLQVGIMDSSTVKAHMVNLSPEVQKAIEMSVRGYADAAIVRDTGLSNEVVGRVTEHFRNEVAKKAVSQMVKVGRHTMGSIIEGGKNFLKWILGAPPAPLQGMVNAGVKNAANVQAQVQAILNAAIPTRRNRNRRALHAAVVNGKKGQKITVFVPYDPTDWQQVYRVARELSTRDATAMSKVYEYWINGILSGPQTHVVNTTSNVLSTLWHYLPQFFASATVNSVIRDPNSTQWGEWPRVWAGFLKGIAPALKNFALAWRTEADPIEYQYLDRPVTVMFNDAAMEKAGGGRSPAIGGPVGRVIRIPGRFLVAMDAFAKTLIMHGEVSAQAYRLGKKRGLSGVALENFMASQIAVHGSESWEGALQTAKELTFQDENDITKAVEDLANAAKKNKYIGLLAKFLFPFIRTPTNIYRTGMRKAGGSAGILLWKLGQAGFYKMKDGRPFFDTYAKGKMVQDVSESVMAGILWFGLMAIAEGDPEDEDRWITMTGTRPYGIANAGERTAQLEGEGGSNLIIIRKNPVTGAKLDKPIRIAYGRYEPLALTMGSIIDAAREFKEWTRLPAGDQTAGKLAGTIASHLASQAQDKTFLQGVSGIMDFFDKLTSKRLDPGQEVAKFLINGAIPNLIRQPLKMSGPEILDSHKAHEILGSANIGNALADGEAKITTGGKPVTRAGNQYLNVLFPGTTEPGKATFYAALKDWNTRHPGEKWNPDPITKGDWYIYDPAKGGTKGKFPLKDVRQISLFEKMVGNLFASKSAIALGKLGYRPGIKATPDMIDAIKKSHTDAIKQVRSMPPSAFIVKAKP